MFNDSSEHLHRSILQAQEEERHRIAREIHDGPAQILANVAMRLDVCQKLLGQQPELVQAELAQLRDLLKLGLQDARRVIANLRPMALDDVGLVPTLHDLVAEFRESSGVEAHLSTEGRIERLAPEVETGLFRCCQEALNNVAQHAKATKVTVRLNFQSDGLSCLTVCDDGQGFDQTAVSERSIIRFGLIGMRERARLLGGSCEISSELGAGTTVTFKIPFQMQAEPNHVY